MPRTAERNQRTAPGSNSFQPHEDPPSGHHGLNHGPGEPSPTEHANWEPDSWCYASTPKRFCNSLNTAIRCANRLANNGSDRPAESVTDSCAISRQRGFHLRSRSEPCLFVHQRGGFALGGSSAVGPPGAAVGFRPTFLMSTRTMCRPACVDAPRVPGWCHRSGPGTGDD